MEVTINFKNGTKKEYGGILWCGREHDLIVFRSDQDYKTMIPVEDVEEVITSDSAEVKRAKTVYGEPFKSNQSNIKYHITNLSE